MNKEKWLLRVPLTFAFHNSGWMNNHETEEHLLALESNSTIVLPIPLLRKAV